MDKFLNFMGRVYFYTGDKGWNGWATLGLIILIAMGIGAIRSLS